MDRSQTRRLEERLARQLLQILGLLGLALIQVTLLPAPFGFPLNPLLVFVALIPLIYDTLTGARLAFYSGIALDLVSAAPLGSHALALLIAVLVVTLISAGISRENLLLPVIAVLVASLCYEVSLALVYRLVPSLAEWQTYLLAVAVPSTLLATIPALPCFLLMRRWLNRRSLPEFSGSRL